MEIQLDIPEILFHKLKEIPNFKEFAVNALQEAISSKKQKTSSKTDLKKRLAEKRKKLPEGAKLMLKDYETDQELTILTHSLAGEDFISDEKK